MEIPQDLKALYSHWEKHTRPIHTQPNVDLDVELLQDIIRFADERMQVWQHKTTVKKPPYTQDPILSQYRFCNIYRELDRQTIQIHQDLLPLRSSFELWLLNLCFQRFVCRPETVKAVGHLSFEEDANLSIMQRLAELDRPKYGTAYVFPVSVIQRSLFPTREEFFCQYLPLVIPSVAKVIKSFDGETVNSALIKILPVFGFNFKFHWTEILIDIAYQFPDKIDLYKDFHIGPGATPTLNRLALGGNVNQVLNYLPQIKLDDFSYLNYKDKPVLLSAENWEGIGCEYRKYSNLKAGGGRKRKYR